eukprot:5726447-Amphidinium_carterae.1
MQSVVPVPASTDCAQFLMPLVSLMFQLRCCLQLLLLRLDTQGLYTAATNNKKQSKKNIRSSGNGHSTEKEQATHNTVYTQILENGTCRCVPKSLPRSVPKLLWCLGSVLLT